MDWNRIEALVSLAGQPLSHRLEELQSDLLGDERRNYYRFLYHLALDLRPGLCLEIGVETGLGSAHMCAAAAIYGGRVVGVDCGNHEVPCDLLPRWYGNYDFVLGNSTADETLRAVRDLVRRYGPAGLVFQDSSHHYWASKAEWEAYRPYLAAGAVWVCDDITPAFHDPKVDPPGRGMVQYFDELPVPPTRKRLFRHVLHYGNTMGVVLT